MTAVGCISRFVVYVEYY